MTPFYMALLCYGHELVEIFQCLGVQVDVPDRVSDITCIHDKLRKY